MDKVQAEGCRALIFSFPGDYHAHAVSWGLRKRGHVADIALLNQIPLRGNINADPANPTQTEIVVDGKALRLGDYDRFWLRRPLDSILPDAVHPSDAAMAQAAWNALRDSLMCGISHRDDFVVDHFPARSLGQMKYYQLQMANDIGLQIPKTMVSNDPAQIRRFIKSNRRLGYKTIVKGLVAMDWALSGGGEAKFATTLVDEEDIDSDSISIAPNIFQRHVEKAFEVRMLALGSTLLAASLESQRGAGGQTDYRLSSDMKSLRAEMVDVPPLVRDHVHKFMSMCGAVSGSFDFVVDVQGAWYFLELNPAGQFLWVEDINPEAPILDAFVDFIVAGNARCDYSPPQIGRLRLSDFNDYLRSADGRSFWSEQEEGIHPAAKEVDHPLRIA